jgi:hypothetical protein
MKRWIVGLVASAFVLVMMACSGPDAEGACSKFDSLCSQSAGDGGVTITTKTKCDAKALEDLSNADEVVDCIKGASDCSAAIACAAKGKK